MYEAKDDGANFLTENPIERYTIGDRTPGLVTDKNGLLSIWIARTDPGEGRSANWLPVPSSGPSMIILRAYLPGPEINAQTYAPPGIEFLSSRTKPTSGGPARPF